MVDNTRRDGALQVLPLVLIRRDGGTQPRVSLDPVLVEEYAAALLKGDIFPPVFVVFDGNDHWLVDGFHRIAATEQNGGEDYPCEVHQGTLREAILYSLRVNTTHGKRRTNEDKRRAVLTMLKDPEWGAKSGEYIAKCCAVSRFLVDTLRGEILPSPALNAGQGNYGKKKGPTRTGADGREYRIDRIQKAAQERAKVPLAERGAIPTGRFGATGKGGVDHVALSDGTAIYRSEGFVVRANSLEIVLTASAEMHQALRRWKDQDRQARIRITVEVLV